MNINPKRVVTLFWQDREATTGGSSNANTGMFPIAGNAMLKKRGIGGYNLANFNVTVNITNSISKFWFEVDEGDGSKPIVVDDDGAGFPLQDELLFDNGRKSLGRNPGSLPTWVNVVVAVSTRQISRPHSSSYTNDYIRLDL